LDRQIQSEEFYRHVGPSPSEETSALSPYHWLLLSLSWRLLLPQVSQLSYLWKHCQIDANQSEPS